MPKLKFPKPEIALTRYKTIGYRINGTVPNVSTQDVHFAVAQAFSIWSAYVPVVFVKRTFVSTADVHITFDPDEPGGPLGNALIEIDTSESFFIDKYKNPVTAQWGPFDLIGVMAHEIGHNVFDLHHNTTPGSMMTDGFGEGQVKRMLHPDDISLAQNKFGKLPSPGLIPMALDAADQINYAPNVVFQAGPDKISISGPGGTASVVQMYNTQVKKKKVNAVILKVRTSSSKAIINSVEIWDTFNLLERHVLSLSSNQNAPRDFEIKVGLPKKPVFKSGLLIRIEVLLLTGGGNQSRSVEISAVDIETVPMPLPEVFTL